MKHFHSFGDRFHPLLASFIAEPSTHAKWLNTLSYLENCGARKIARTEHPRDVSRQMLKHAAEEFRHAYYLKQQITTRLGASLPSYDPGTMWGGWETLRYLDRLEVMICRLLKGSCAHPRWAYFLLTYAIELRAFELYPIYQDLLIQMKAPVSVRSILLEEKGHLEEMREEIAILCIDEQIVASVCRMEGILCQKWLERLEIEQMSAKA
jgi:hypothetical protein